MRNRARDRDGRWDLFLLLNRKAGFSKFNSLQPIPEEQEMRRSEDFPFDRHLDSGHDLTFSNFPFFSEHHCDRRTHGETGVDPENRGQNTTKNSSEEGQKVRV